MHRWALTAIFLAGSLQAQSMSPAEVEDFLKSASMGPRKALSTGINATERTTLTKGDVKHDAHISTVDIYKAEFRTDREVQLNFKDTYKFNIAAYRLNRILGMNMMPVTIERKVAGKSASVAWWVDNAMMEGERIKKKTEPPDQERWNKQMYMARMFDELIYDTDPNLGNFLIDPNWKLWMVDKTRAFRISNDLRNVKNLAKCERTVYGALKKLDEATLKEQMKGLLNSSEIKGLLARRDKIVKFFENEIKTKGENEVLFDMPELLGQ